MHISLLGLLTTATMVLGECYLDGENWGNQLDKAHELAHDVCDKYWSGVAFNEAVSKRSACYNIDSTKMVEFRLQRITSGGDLSISAADCYDGLRKEIGGCPHGGHSGYTHWLFTADPNSGQCS